MHRAAAALPGSGTAWRVVENSAAKEPLAPLRLSSNRADPESDAFAALRPEQRRSLTWMLAQEQALEFEEEEVEEAAGLGWRLEARASRRVVARGGVLADEVGYGKTVITVGLISTAPPIPARGERIPTRATLVFAPAHLLDQWPDEVRRFNPRLKVVAVKTMATLGALTVRQVQEANVIVVSISVLRSDLYFERMMALAGQAPVAAKAARFFAQLYGEAVEALDARVVSLQLGDLSRPEAPRARAVLEPTKRLVGAALVAEPKAPKPAKEAKPVGDPWGLETISDFRNMKCAPFELFHFERVVVDEFTYLPAASRERAVVQALSCGARWCLSGTPPVASFEDVRGIAGFGTPDTPDFKSEQTRAEAFLFYSSSRTHAWHARRHAQAQAFLDRFVRQNIAEIDEIPFTDSVERVSLAPAERAIYLELEHHLAAMDMRQRRSKRSGAAAGGDREARLRSVLGKSKTPDEALLKRCAHFDLEGSGGTALEVCRTVVRARQQQLGAGRGLREGRRRADAGPLVRAGGAGAV
jgi:hypothetical protein